MFGKNTGTWAITILPRVCRSKNLESGVQPGLGLQYRVQPFYMVSQLLGHIFPSSFSLYVFPRNICDTNFLKLFSTGPSTLGLVRVVLRRISSYQLNKTPMLAVYATLWSQTLWSKVRNTFAQFLWKGIRYCSSLDWAASYSALFTDFSR